MKVFVAKNSQMCQVTLPQCSASCRFVLRVNVSIQIIEFLFKSDSTVIEK